MDFLNVHANSSSIASATIGLLIDGEQVIEAAVGNGAVDAAYRALGRISDRAIGITEYKLAAAGTGANALGQVDLIAEYNGRAYHGAGISTDIVEASVRAYVNVLNLCERAKLIEDKKQVISAGV